MHMSSRTATLPQTSEMNNTPTNFYRRHGARPIKERSRGSPDVRAPEDLSRTSFRGQQTYQPRDDLFTLPESRMPSYSDDDGEDHSLMDDHSVLNDYSAPRPNQLIVTPASTGQLLSGRAPMRTAPTRSRATVTPQRQPGIVAMLQEQQGLLHQILNEQQKLREIVEENKRRIEEVEKGLKSVTDEWSNSTASAVSSSPAWERKRTIPRDLTVI